MRCSIGGVTNFACLPGISGLLREGVEIGVGMPAPRIETAGLEYADKEGERTRSWSAARRIATGPESD